MSVLRCSRAVAILGLVITGGSAHATDFERAALDNGLVLFVGQNAATDLVSLFVGFRISADAETQYHSAARALLQEHHRAHAAELLETDPAFGPLRADFESGPGIRFETEWDYVQVQACCTLPNLEILLKLLATIFLDDPLSSQLVQSAGERLVAYHTKARTRAPEQTYYLFRRAMLGDRPTGRPVFADPESIEGLTVEELTTFRQRYFTAGNAVIVVISPQSTEHIGQLVRQHFGPYPKGVAPLPSPSGAPTLRDSQVQVAGNPSSRLAYIVLGAALPPPGTQGFLVGQILHQVLAGKQGRLQRDHGLLRSLALNLPFRLLATHFPLRPIPVALEATPHLAIYAECDPTAIEATRQGLLRHLNSFRDGSIHPDELTRAKRRVINNLALSMQRPLNIATRLGQYEMLGLAYTDAQPTAAQVDAITIEDVTDTAKTHFAQHYIGVLLPDPGPTSPEDNSEPGSENHD